MRCSGRPVLPLLLLACGVAFAQGNNQNQPPPDPFAALPAAPGAWENGSLPGAAARYSETLAILKQRLDAAPTDVEALEWANELLERMQRASQLTPYLFEALKAGGLEGKPLGRLRGLLGHLLLAQANELGFGGGVVIWIGGGGGPMRRMQGERSEEALKLLRAAEPHLRAALEADPRDLRALSDLIEVLGDVDQEKNAEEVRKLRVERAAAAVTKPSIFRLPAVQMDVRANELRDQAAAMETRRKQPDHGGALPLRREALVLAFCNRTIPFEYRASLYPAVSLLAPETMVQQYLTRQFTKLSGESASVPVQYFPASEQRRVEIVRGLATDLSDCATATLLAVLRRATVDGPVEQAAAEALVRNERPVLKTYLPALLSIAIYNDELYHYPALGQRQLVLLVGRLRMAEAAPVLVVAAARPRFDLFQPRGLLEALGRTARLEDAELLLRIARDPKRDVYFRRRAVDALSAMDAEIPTDLDDHPLLALSVAAAHYRKEPTEALKGRIFTALEDEHQADDAAAYCVELGLRDALPLIEAQAGKRKDHYSGPLLAKAYLALQR